MIFVELLSRKGRPKVDVVLSDQCHCERLEPPGSIRLFDRRPRALCRIAAGPSDWNIFSKPMNLPAAQSQNIRRRRRRHPTLSHLAQNLDPVQLALAHQNPSHAHTLCLFSLGQV